MPRISSAQEDARALLDELTARQSRLQQRRVELSEAESQPPHAVQDLTTDLRHLTRQILRVEAYLSGEPPATAESTAKRPPWIWRALRVLGRRAREGVADAGRGLQRQLQRRRRPTAGEPPELSVVIPTHNRSESLRRTLDAYGRQISELSVVVVVVDDGSEDATQEILAQFDSDRFELIALHQKSSGPAAARNLGLAAARGRWVLFTGDDIEPRPDLLLRHWQAHAGDPRPGPAVLGLTRWPPGEELTATMIHIDGPGAQQFNYSWLKPGREYDFRHFYTSNVSLAKELLVREDGFNTDFPHAAFEDAELAYRLSRHGLRIRYVADAVAFHHHPYGAAAFYTRQQRCGRMARILEDLHPELALWTGRRPLEERRVDLLFLTADRRRQLIELTETFDLYRSHALTVAAALDPIRPPGTDAFLRALFHLAVWEGLSDGLPGAERWLMSAIADFLAEPSRELLPHLEGDAHNAAETLAALPGFCRRIERENVYPVRKK